MQGAIGGFWAQGSRHYTDNTLGLTLRCLDFNISEMVHWNYGDGTGYRVPNVLEGARPLQRSLLGTDRWTAWRATTTRSSKWDEVH